MQPKRKTKLKKVVIMGTLMGILVTLGLEYEWCSRMTWQIKEIKYSAIHVETFNDLPKLNIDSAETPANTVGNTNQSTSRFDFNGSDVLVQIHIQKTGGSLFELKLVNDLILEKKCEKIRKGGRFCPRPNSETEQWLLSRRTSDWGCGVHADWTNFQQCLNNKTDITEKTDNPKLRHFFITILRDPLSRYLSEWLHVRRGATWRRVQYVCDHQHSTIPKCYSGDNWLNVTLEEFMNCPYNMANNRQTRMLADLRLVECYDMFISQEEMSNHERDELQKKMLASAKQNLEAMSFFGITERMEDSLELFENTFHRKFRPSVGEKNPPSTESTQKDDMNVPRYLSKFGRWRPTRASGYQPTEQEKQKIYENNQLDMELCDFAEKLFNKRLAAIR